MTPSTGTMEKVKSEKKEPVGKNWAPDRDKKKTEKVRGKKTFRLSAVLMKEKPDSTKTIGGSRCKVKEEGGKGDAIVNDPARGPSEGET